MELSVVANWRQFSSTPTQTTEDYAASRQADGDTLPRWEWKTDPYRGRDELVERAWGPELNRALPQVSPATRTVREMFNSLDGSVVTDSLVGRRVWVPYWLVFAATAALPLASVLARLRRSRRSHLNLCPRCGYDLRATPGRCPECGTRAAGKAA